jgi:hypothetical protein
MSRFSSRFLVSHQASRPERIAVLAGFVVFAILWGLYGFHYGAIYIPNSLDIPALADGALLAPDAHWTNWFTRGYADFWNLYPDWQSPSNTTAFTRPLFQLTIYLAHFLFGRNWALYAAIGCLAVAGVAALAFQISRTALNLSAGLSLLAAALVVLSGPVLENWMRGLAFAIEPLVTVFIAGSFLAAVARRDILCLVLLFLALLTKEAAVWAALASAVTIVLRPKPDEPLLRRALIAASMLLPIAAWAVFRWKFFGGIGGTYATAGYSPLSHFLGMAFSKLTHLQNLLVWYPDKSAGWGYWTAIGTSLLLYAMLVLLAFRFLSGAVHELRQSIHKKRWPTADAASLVTLWAAIGLAFYLAVPLGHYRYASSAVIFAWPALVAEVDKRRQPLVWLVFAACCVVAIVQGTFALRTWMSESISENSRQKSMHLALRNVPPSIQQVFVFSTRSGLERANPKYVRLVLGVPTEIVRVAEIDWKCGPNDQINFNHRIADGEVTITLTVPECATFSLLAPSLGNNLLARLHRGHSITYELAEKPWAEFSRWYGQRFTLGRTITVHIRPAGSARIIVDRGRGNEIAWFDTL